MTYFALVELGHAVFGKENTTNALGVIPRTKQYLRHGNDLLKENAVSKRNELLNQRLGRSFNARNMYHPTTPLEETEYAPKRERNVLDLVMETWKREFLLMKQNTTARSVAKLKQTG